MQEILQNKQRVPDKEKRRSNAERHSHGSGAYERRSEAELRIKFFAQLSFKKAGERRSEAKLRIKFFCLLFFQEKEGRVVMRTTMAVRSSVACWGLLAMRSRASSLGLSPSKRRNRSRSHWSS